VNDNNKTALATIIKIWAKAHIPHHNANHDLKVVAIVRHNILRCYLRIYKLPCFFERIRKNYYGCGSLWSGELTAALFTLFQTALINKINAKKYFTAYLQACAENKGLPPPNLDSFLPWNL